jgi:hypothetical protein
MPNPRAGSDEVTQLMEGTADSVLISELLNQGVQILIEVELADMLGAYAETFRVRPAKGFVPSLSKWPSCSVACWSYKKPLIGSC